MRFSGDGRCKIVRELNSLTGSAMLSPEQPQAFFGLVFYTNPVNGV